MNNIIIKSLHTKGKKKSVPYTDIYSYQWLPFPTICFEFHLNNDEDATKKFQKIHNIICFIEEESGAELEDCCTAAETMINERHLNPEYRRVVETEKEYDFSFKVVE